MYVGIDIGGTKTLVAALSDNGEIAGSIKFATPEHYEDFLPELKHYLAALPFVEYRAGAIGAPGTVDRHRGILERGGNIKWQNVHLLRDIEKLTGCPMLLENDANLAGLSEAMLLKDQYRKVLYITISTGIGTGFIVDRQIEPNMADSEGGLMMIQHGDKLAKWESFGSGSAIFKKYGKKASEIDDQKTWQEIVRTWTAGFLDLLAVTEPDVIVLGGGVGHYLPKYHDLLMAELKQYETPMVPIPPIVQAGRPEEAVAYGCYDLARSVYA